MPWLLMPNIALIATDLDVIRLIDVSLSNSYQLILAAATVMVSAVTLLPTQIFFYNILI